MSKSTIVILCALLLWAFPSGGQTPRTLELNAKGFFRDATERLEKKVSAEKLKEIQIALQRQDIVKATDLVYQFSKTSSTKSAVTVHTSKGPAAMVRYQTLGQRKRGEAPTTAKSLTALTQQMYLGRYFIWSERNGEATSNKESEFDILETAEKVVLQEK